VLARVKKPERTTWEAYAMRPIAVIGIIFIVIGILALAYQGFSYTTKEKVVDLGPLKVEAKREKTIPLPPVLGVLAVGAGVVLVVVGARGR
jgi:amino acid transporter